MGSWLCAEKTDPVLPLSRREIRVAAFLRGFWTTRMDFALDRLLAFCNQTLMTISK